MNHLLAALRLGLARHFWDFLFFRVVLNLSDPVYVRNMAENTSWLS